MARPVQLSMAVDNHRGPGERILLGEERHGRHIASHVQPRGLVARLAILLQDAQNVGIEGGGFVHCRWRPIGGGYRQGVGLLGSASPATGPRTATPVTTSEPKRRAPVAARIFGPPAER